MQVNERAPVVARHQLDVAAEPMTVWAVMSDFDRWPQWNPEVRSVTVDGPLAPGTQFRWKAGPSTITSILRSVEPPSELGWTGTTLGIRATHVWRTQPQPGGSRISIEETWEGLMARLFRRSFQERLDRSCRDGLEAIKREAERLAAAA